MTLCVVNGKQCNCQPDEGVWCEHMTEPGLSWVKKFYQCGYDNGCSKALENAKIGHGRANLAECALAAMRGEGK